MNLKSRGVAGWLLAALTLVATLSLAGAISAATTPSSPTSDSEVVPYIISPAGPGGNVTCAMLGYANSSDRVNWVSGGFDKAFPDGITVTVTDGTFVEWTSTFEIGAVIVKGSNAANIYEYDPASYRDSGLASPVNASGGSAGLSNLTFCWGDPVEGDDGRLIVKKFYDANADGDYDAGTDTYLTGWKIDINGSIFYTLFDQPVLPNDYTVSEFDPVPLGTWMATTAKSFDVTVAPNETETIEFGNLCLGAGGGLTLGFWSNKNGKALFETGGDLALMVSLNLRNANGSDFNPASYAAFRTWLLGATATNMAYMLSAQLAAMELNVLNGKVSGTALIYAPGTTSANALGFATVNAVMDEADSSLGTNGYTVAAGATRTYQEALKNALDKANNNLSFVQATPCAFSFASPA